MRVETLTADGALLAFSGKPIYGSSFRRQLALCSEARVEGGLWTVDYFVLDAISGLPFSVAKTKAEALSAARELCEQLDWPRVHVLCAQHELAKQEYLRELDKAQDDGPKPRRISKRRINVYTASDGKCTYCAKALDLAGGWHVDHKTPLSRGGNDLPENLTAACVKCNLVKHDKTAEEFMAMAKTMGVK